MSSRRSRTTFSSCYNFCLPTSNSFSESVLEKEALFEGPILNPESRGACSSTATSTLVCQVKVPRMSPNYEATALCGDVLDHIFPVGIESVDFHPKCVFYSDIWGAVRYLLASIFEHLECELDFH
jgi:hypothetical protein